MRSWHSCLQTETEATQRDIIAQATQRPEWTSHNCGVAGHGMRLSHPSAGGTHGQATYPASLAQVASGQHLRLRPLAHAPEITAAL